MGTASGPAPEWAWWRRGSDGARRLAGPRARWSAWTAESGWAL